eukprot:gene2019-2486_t
MSLPTPTNNDDDKYKEIKDEWIKIQNELKEQMIKIDDIEWTLNDNGDGKCLKYIGGVDISFVKDNQEDACSSLVVLEYPSLKVVYQDLRFVKLTLPYIPSFLAFRETPFLMDQINAMRQSNSPFIPQVILVDGNGLLHPRGFGLACHLGVLSGIPTIGIGKTFFHVDGLDAKSIKDKVINGGCKDGGDHVKVVGESGKVWGAAVISHKDSKNPIYVSQGHRLSLDTCLQIVKLTTTYRIPEPVRQADLKSREYIRLNCSQTN